MESKEELPEDATTQPIPILQISSEDIVIYQRQLQLVNKTSLAKNRFSCFVYVDSLHSDYWKNLFSLYQLVQQFPEVTFVVTLRGVKTPEDFNDFQTKFFYAKSFNLFLYKSGLHKALLSKHSFDSMLFILFSEQMELMVSS